MVVALDKKNHSLNKKLVPSAPHCSLQCMYWGPHICPQWTQAIKALTTFGSLKNCAFFRQ